jgi:hypothetical protein
MASMFIPGAQWLGALGMGMSAVDAAMNGNPGSAVTAAMKAGKTVQGLGNWTNPASGNLYEPGGAEINALWNKGGYS